mmetsp:Transcript_21476/g.54131  ORF Transcript_21476/g.54131 Transcript_21476/m.54131 type:complete len:243 (+) Transcript_21476:671-1399(+)
MRRVVTWAVTAQGDGDSELGGSPTIYAKMPISSGFLDKKGEVWVCRRIEEVVVGPGRVPIATHKQIQVNIGGVGAHMHQQILGCLHGVFKVHPPASGYIARGGFVQPERGLVPLTNNPGCLVVALALAHETTAVVGAFVGAGSILPSLNGEGEGRLFPSKQADHPLAMASLRIWRQLDAEFVVWGHLRSGVVQNGWRFALAQEDVDIALANLFDTDDEWCVRLAAVNSEVQPAVLLNISVDC